MKQKKNRLLTLLALSIAISLPIPGFQAGAHNSGVMVAQVIPVSMLPGTFRVLNAGAGDQIDPHVDGTIAAYTNDEGGFRTVRYFNFATGAGCEIYTAIQSEPGIFTTRQVTADPGNKQYPDTDGTWVVCTDDASGDLDVCVQPVAGGVETRIPLPGDQLYPAISGNRIVFASGTVQNGVENFDLFLYDLASKRLYQVTDTPGDEWLSDITFINGVGRIVYMAEGTNGYDLFAFTFELDDSVAGLLTDLISFVRSLNLPGGIETSLLAKLEDALAAVTNSDLSGACDALTAFTSEVRAQSRGLYIVLATADVYVDGFCSNFDQYHGRLIKYGIGIKYAFVGNPWRCPQAVAPQFVAPDGSPLPTPNDDLAGDAIVSSMAHVISGMMTNPAGTAWFDRYGLENSDKCQGTFGQTYTTANGAQANVRLGGRDYLIQQNWVNDRRGHCGLSIR